MGKLIYAANISLDGFLEDETGSFDWSVPDEDVHAFWNEHERHIGTSLYGRRMYETMRVWESDDWLTDEPPVVREYAGIWRDADKVVYSTSLTDVSTARTRIERQFEPEAVRRLKETSGSDLSIGGAGIAAEAFRHGLVDECVLLLCPVLVGGGKPALPRGVRLNLELLDHATIRQRRGLRPPRGPTPRLTLAPDSGRSAYRGGAPVGPSRALLVVVGARPFSRRGCMTWHAAGSTLGPGRSPFRRRRVRPLTLSSDHGGSGESPEPSLLRSVGQARGLSAWARAWCAVQ